MVILIMKPRSLGAMTWAWLRGYQILLNVTMLGRDGWIGWARFALDRVHDIALRLKARRACRCGTSRRYGRVKWPSRVPRFRVKPDNAGTRW